MGLPIPAIGPTQTLGIGGPTHGKTRTHTIHRHKKQAMKNIGRENKKAPKVV